MHATTETPAAEIPPNDRLLRMPDVEKATGLKKSTIYELMRENRFPQCIRLGRRLSAWPESRIQRWVHDRIAGAAS